jgi:lauroyl/myristoyl acyltransferase
MNTAHHTGYRNGYVTIQQQVRARELKKKNELQQKDFNFLSANLLNFLPEVSLAKHEEIYLNILLNNARISAETYFPELIDQINIEGDAAIVEQNRKKAKIYCTYHVGSYRSIIGYLAKTGIDFVLIVDTNTFNKQRDRIKHTVKSIGGHFGNTAYFELVDAERVDIGITLSKYLMMGVSVVIYLDGNTGVGGIYNKNDQMLHIDFLEGQIFSRKGVSALSYATKSLIVPVISYYNEHGNIVTLKFYDAIKPEDYPKEKESYCLQVTSALYGLLADNLKVYYNQWEGWLYLHKYLEFSTLNARYSVSQKDIPVSGSRQVISFNDIDFGLFKIEADCYLFNKRTYKSFVISEATLSYLHTLKTQEIQLPDASADHTFIKQLADKGIIRVNG